MTDHTDKNTGRPAPAVDELQHDDQSSSEDDQSLAEPTIANIDRIRSEEDYQTQLMLLEQQNKKRLLRAKYERALQEYDRQAAMLLEHETNRNPDHPQEARNYMQALQSYQKACKAVDQYRTELQSYGWTDPQMNNSLEEPRQRDMS